MDFSLYPRRNPHRFFSEPMDVLACGMAAWGGMGLLTHPLRMLEVRMQQDQVMGQRRGFRDMLRVVGKEGWLRGMGLNAGQLCAQRLFIPMAYEKWKVIRINNAGVNIGLYCEKERAAAVTGGIFGKHEVIMKSSMGVGWVIGFFDGILSHIFSQRMIQEFAVQRMESHRVRKSFSEICAFSRRDFAPVAWASGVVGMFKWGIFFVFYEDMLLRYAPERQSVLDFSLAGMFAGGLATLISHPFETVLTFMRSNPHPALVHGHPQGLLVAARIVQDKGVFLMYTGLGLAMARSCLMWGATFGAYEYLRRAAGMYTTTPWVIERPGQTWTGR